MLTIGLVIAGLFIIMLQIYSYLISLLFANKPNSKQNVNCSLPLDLEEKRHNKH